LFAVPIPPDNVWPQLVRERFSFLVREHGYAAPVATVYPRCFNSGFAREPLNVSVASEHYEPPVIYVTRREPFASLSVFEVIALLEPAYADERPRTPRSGISNDEFAAWLDYYASFAERHARALFEEPDELFAQVAGLRARKA